MKQYDVERKITNNRCSDLVEENGDLKFKIQQLESALVKVSNGEKSLNMLLKNQFSSGNISGLGFGKSEFSERRSSNDFKNPSTFFEKNRLDNLNFVNSKGFLNEKQNLNLFCNNSSKQSWIPKGDKTNLVKFKQIWVPKGTKVDSNGLLYKQVWVPKQMGTTVSGFTNFVRPLVSSNC